VKAGQFIFGVMLAAEVVAMSPSVFAQATYGQTVTSKASRDTAWVRDFAASAPLSTAGTGIGRENQLLGDSRFIPLLRESFPQKQWFWYDHWKLTPLPDMMQIFMGVPGNAVLDENRYVTVDGCVLHDCDGNRGMLWIDTGLNPATLIFVGIDPITSQAAPWENHLWIFTSKKLNWQQAPAPFVSSLHRWLATIGTKGYFDTNGFRYNFAIITIVQPNGVMVDLGPDTFGLGDESKRTSGTGL
jgi:hypothetical protein